MNSDFFVQKVKYLCLQKGIRPTNACKECGVGGSFLSDIMRGRMPSIDKVEKLAAYLGTTVSDLIGETKLATLGITEQPYLVFRFNQLSEADQKEVLAFIDFKVNMSREKTEKLRAESKESH